MRLQYLAVLFFSLFLTGCSLPGSSFFSVPAGGIYFSADGGNNFSKRSTIDEKKTLAKENILAIRIDPGNSDRLWAGTEAAGLFLSEDAGNKWRQVMPGQRIYGVVIDPRDTNRVYVTGIFGTQGKIKKSNDGGNNWEDIYVEPAGGSLIASLEYDPYNPDVLYAGSSRGTLLKSVDQGKNWENIGELDGPITGIAMDVQESRDVYLLVFEKGVFKIDYSGSIKNRKGTEPETDSENKLLNGVKIVDLRTKIPSKLSAKKAMVIKADPKKSRVIYLAGEGGLARSVDGGETWQEIPTLEESAKKPIRQLAIGGDDSQIIYFSASGAFYNSADTGKTWQALEFKTKYAFEVLELDPKDAQKVYLGLRKIK